MNRNLPSLKEIRAAAQVFSAIDAAMASGNDHGFNRAARIARAPVLDAAGRQFVEFIIAGLLGDGLSQDALIIRDAAGFPHARYGEQGYAKTVGAICHILTTVTRDDVIVAGIQNVLYGEI